MLLISCGTNEKSKNSAVKIYQNKDEDFDQFFKKFCNDSTFQISRITFPLTLVSVEEDSDKEKTIQLKEWTYTNLLGLKKKDSKNILEIKKIGENSIEVSFSIEDTGVSIIHLFSRVDKEWHLISIKDESD